MISLQEIAKSINEDPRGVDNIDRSKGAEKKDQDADRVGRDDGDTWMAPNGDYGGKHNGEIQYFGDEEQAKVYAKSGSKDGKGGEEKPEEPKGNIGKGDFDRDFDDDEPKGEPKGEPEGGEEPSGEKFQAATDKVTDLRASHKGSMWQLIDKLKKMKKSEVDDIQKTLSDEKERLLQKATGEEDGISTFDNEEDTEAYWAASKDASDFYNMTHHYADRFKYKPEDKEEPKGDEEPKDEPKGKLSPKKQAAVDELEYLSDPDEIGDWLEDNQFYLRKGRLGRAGQIYVDKFIDKYRDLEDSYGDDDEYDEKLQNLKDMINKTMDRYRKKSESIKVINGKKYKAIKESKKHPLKEIYDRTFRSLK